LKSESGSIKRESQETRNPTSGFPGFPFKDQFKKENGADCSAPFLLLAPEFGADPSAPKFVGK
jgi:hypothetical protein